MREGGVHFAENVVNHDLHGLLKGRSPPLERKL